MIRFVLYGRIGWCLDAAGLALEPAHDFLVRLTPAIEAALS